jgi:photosystem II stability/assembly factor-like uncharacterized protein
MRAYVLLLALGLVAGVTAPASAQWSRVTALPARDVFCVRTRADTIAAGVDTALFVSTDAGATWHKSAKPVAGVSVVSAVWILNHRLYIGTFGQGVFVSDNLGATWQAFNQGLVGGAFDSQLDIADFEQRGDSLFVATEGSSVFVRRLSGVDTWHLFGNAFEANEDPNVTDLALGGAGNTRLFACAGVNGDAFDRDPGAADWTVSTFRNGPLVPGSSAVGRVEREPLGGRNQRGSLPQSHRSGLVDAGGHRLPGDEAVHAGAPRACPVHRLRFQQRLLALAEPR